MKWDICMYHKSGLVLIQLLKYADKILAITILQKNGGTNYQLDRHLKNLAKYPQNIIIKCFWTKMLPWWRFLDIMWIYSSWAQKVLSNTMLEKYRQNTQKLTKKEKKKHWPYSVNSGIGKSISQTSSITNMTSYHLRQASSSKYHGAFHSGKILPLTICHIEVHGFVISDAGLDTATSHVDMLKARGYTPSHFQKRVIAKWKMACNLT